MRPDVFQERGQRPDDTFGDGRNREVGAIVQGAMDVGKTPFRGSVAVTAGFVTKSALRGPRFTRLLPDVYVRGDAPVDLRARAIAAYLNAHGRGIIAGWAAAELLGAPCAPADAEAEIVLSDSDRRARPGLRVHRFRPHPGEVRQIDGIAVTSPLRTAYDLARRETLVRAVTAVDALARIDRFDPEAVLALARRHPGVRGTRRLPRVVALSDPRAESPGESRMRLAIVLAGLPVPVPQHRVGRFRLDLAYPEVMLGVEYDGADHLTPGRARRDLTREAELARAGWELVHVGGDNSMREIAILVARALAARGVPTPNVSPESIAALS